MKILLKLIFSIFLAACISILLMYAGVLTFKGNGTVTEFKKKAGPVYHRIVDVLNERLTVNENPVPDKENSKSVSTINKTVQKPDINDDSENRIYAEALAFLKRSTIDGKSDVKTDAIFQVGPVIVTRNIACFSYRIRHRSTIAA